MKPILVKNDLTIMMSYSLHTGTSILYIKEHLFLGFMLNVSTFFVLGTFSSIFLRMYSFYMGMFLKMFNFHVWIFSFAKPEMR